MALFRLLERGAARWPAASLRSQPEGLVLSFGDLERRAAATAAALRDRGYRGGEALVSDLGNVSRNVVLQLACSRLGVAYATAKNAKALAALTAAVDVRGAVVAAGGAGDALSESLATIRADDLFAEADRRLGDDASGAGAVHAYFNSTTPLANDEVDALAADAAAHLELSAADTACVSITLSHAFGAASAVGVCFSAGASVALPNVDGIVGCGVPSERAAATLACLERDACTVLFADTHTLNALPADADLPALRTGVCKVASGADFLDRSAPFAGRHLWTLGKRAAS